MAFEVNVGKDTTVKVEYVWVPALCINCKVFGHSVASCPNIATRARNQRGGKQRYMARNIQTELVAQTEPLAENLLIILASLVALAILFLEGELIY